MSISRIIKKLTSKKANDFRVFETVGEGGNGRAEVRRSHWDPGVTVEVPVNFQPVPGEKIQIRNAKGSNQLPFSFKRAFSGAAEPIQSELILIGIWGQAWGNPYRNGIGAATVSPGGDFVGDYPGSATIALTGGPSGDGLIRCIVYLPEGKIGIAKWIEDGGDLAIVRFLVVAPNDTNNWPVLDYHDFELTLDRDRKGGQGYLSDCYGFYDEQTKFVTLFTRMFNSLPSEAPDGTLATALTISVADPDNLALPNIGTIQVSAASNSANRLTARAMNVAGGRMVKGAFNEIQSPTPTSPSWDKQAHVFTYSQNSGGTWDLVQAVNWLNQAMDEVFTPRYSEPDNRPAYLPSDVRGIGLMPGDSGVSNNRPQYGPPFAQIGSNRYFFGVACGVRQIGVSDRELVGLVATNYVYGVDFRENKVVEVQVNAATGIVSFATILAETSYTQSQAIKLANSIATKAAAYPPSFEPTTFSEARVASCFGDNYPYTYTEEKFYLGAIYEPYVNPWNDEDVRSPDLGAGKFCGVVQSQIWPNYTSASSGRRYGAITRSIPYWIAEDNLGLRRVLPGEVKSEFYLPHPETSDGNNFSLQAFPFIQTGTPCGVAIRREYNGVYVPRLVHMEATCLVTIGPGLTGPAQLLELPHSRHEFSAGDPGVPIREEFFQAIAVEELGVVLWLHNWRDSRQCGLGIPMITVTGLDGASVLFEIPANEFFPTTKFASNQFVGTEFGTEIWAYEGEFDHYCNGVDGLGPLMKVVKLGEDFKLVLSAEYYKRAFPGDYGYLPTNGFDSFSEADSQGLDGVTFQLSSSPAVVTRVYVNEYSNEVGYTFTAPNTIVLSAPITDPDSLAVEYTWTIDGASPPETGTTWRKSFILDITADEYTLEKIVEDSANWTFPNIERPFVNFGPEEIRQMFIGQDRVIIGLKQIKT